jgi:hypothetical protein
MAAATLKSGVLSQERITSLAVVKAIAARLPMNYGEVFPEMLGVASNTILTALTSINHSRVVSLIFLNALKNLFVALNAFELPRPSTKAVAGSAVTDAVQGTMRFGKRTWGDLREGRMSWPRQQQKY